jgi:hypothetical protein
MYRAGRCLVSFGFLATFGLASAHAQPLGQDVDGPIATARLAITPAPVDDVVPAQPLPTGPINLVEGRAVASAETLAAMDSPQAEAMAASQRAEVELAAEDGKSIEIGPNATLSSRSADAGEAVGGLLRTNPSLQRANRKKIGLAFKF